MAVVLPAPPRRPGPWRAKLLAGAGSIVFALVLGELVLRLIGFSEPYLYRRDELLGVALRPGVEGWYQREGRAYIAVNRHGMRDVDHAVAKPPGTFRIAVLGDSFAEAVQVPVEQTFWWHLGGRLNERHAFSGRHVEVLNFGVSSYGTAQELLQLRQRVWAFGPDVVLLAVLTGNDLRDNSLALEAGPRPYLVVRDGWLVPDNRFRDDPTFQARNSAMSNAYTELRNRVRLLHLFSAVRDRWLRSQPRVNPGPDQPEPGMDEAIYRAPETPEWAEAWQVTEQLLLALRDEVASHGARLAVVTLSNSIQVHPDPGVRTAAERRLGVEDLFYPDRRLRDFLQGHGIDVLSLAPPLQQYAEERQVFLHGFAASGNLGRGHWNEAGHRRAGELMADWLASRGP